MKRTIPTVEVVLWTTALVCASAVGTCRWRAHAAERAALRVEPRSSLSAAPASPIQDGIFGRIEIPALALTAPLVEDGDQALSYGVEHIPGSAQPGSTGNFALAAHRDTFFRPLRGVRPGMTVRVVTFDKTFTYLVDRTRIVAPQNTSVLDKTRSPQLTLVTCYPFYFIGPAPKRFIVIAHLVTS